jgi:hypothetical protein
MPFVQTDSIRNVEKRGNVINFEDGLEIYSFNTSKNTLYKMFKKPQNYHSFEVNIFEDPYMLLERMYEESVGLLKPTDQVVFPYVILPLYGYDDKDKTIKKVFEKSGLNQWNASGRARHENEAYIPIPAKVHELKKSFFPSRDTPFNLKLPNGKVICAKVCQDNSKALMSQSNRELGEWLLRTILKTKSGQLISYEDMENIGVDSVRVEKLSDELFEIDFAKVGAYEEFISSFE